MTIKLAIFDFDGTLANTFAVFGESLNTLALKHRFRQVVPEDELRMRAMSAAEILRELRLPLWRVPAVLSDYRKMMRHRIDEVYPFAGIVTALEALLDHGVELAVATSNTADNVNAVLGRELTERFAALECGSTLFGKAHRLRRILKQTSTAPEQAIYIGDELRDAEAARRVGMQFGAVAWGYTRFDALLQTNPGMVFRAPSELASVNTRTPDALPPTDVAVPEPVRLVRRHDDDSRGNWS
ncbi:HAD hydrolase-like protein [Paraburkholderia rhizosphaerae]|uniref:Phosphoglycolate phosphatase n=1 Tax=Paraburkholderia rhizosphaerae TaxID=480658 RepID=A0A4R8LTN3_9BURK|nr:HAD hydrolase-like protein [Paraburkholderia rhizosphaerae]TDY50878.1 phosphoglycolate phosphatase [Paraburkholderia rhizosphaerae]